MACLDATIRSSRLLLGAAVLLAGCPDDPVSPIDSESSTAGSTGDECTPGTQADCTCPSGTPSTQTCRADGTGYDACQCGDPDSTSGDPTVDDSGTSTGPGEESTTTVGVECTSDDECSDLAVGECEVPQCSASGTCVPNEAPAGTPCGDQADAECSDPDTCDAAGNCSPNDAVTGSSCASCPGDECTCNAGLCGECTAYAPTNNFITTRSIQGWQLTGSWGLHRVTPSSEQAVGSEFVGQVLGSNGNRVEPYPGNEIEVSYARTPPVPLPATIVFLSWNVDEGGATGSDNKTVRVSVDGGASWVTLADCTLDASWPMCAPTPALDPAVFDLVQIPVPPELRGQSGIVEFGYDTGDACCDFEKGWYIDSLNLAQECACAIDEDCAAFGSACGTGICGFSGECALAAMDEGDACGDPFENECNGADECDGLGYCRDNLQASGLTTCDDCPSGDTCSYCDAGQCLDCVSFTDFTGFSDPAAMPPWTTSASPGPSGWGFYDSAPQNDFGVGPTVFPNGPVYGTDGNQMPPYPTSHDETSQAVTSIGVVPFELIFGSWNVDEGTGVDTKTIEISVNGGASWTVLESCNQGSTQPFCNFVDDTRAIDDWDVITLDTSPWAGQNGQLRFGYSTGDSCCGFERGWYLDFSYAICDDIAFP